MSGSTLAPEVLAEVIKFHGHSCPGLAIGIRAAEVALAEFGGPSGDEELVAVVETNMCGVDGIQFLTSCTFGKGNLIHLDYGKKAFSFYRRSDEKGIRLVMKADFFQKIKDGMGALQKKRVREGLTSEEQEQLREKMAQRIKLIMAAPAQELFAISEAPGPVPRKARVLESVTCEMCGEETMESRIHRFLGQSLCPPCFEAAEAQ